jgi:hypothetical protein
MIPARTSSCPTDLDLEGHLQVPDLRVQAHVAACRRCTALLTESRVAGERFEREIAPYHLQRVLRALEAEPPRQGFLTRFRPLAVGFAAVAIAGLAGVVAVQRPTAPVDPQLPFGPKGDGLQVFLRHGEDVKAARDGNPVAPGDLLRFTVIPPGPRFVLVFSVDARGAISRLHDADEAIDLPTTLPGSAMLDSVPGPERVFAVFSTRHLAWSEVERAVGAALPAPSEAAVRGLHTLPLVGDEQATLLLERGG